mgnify:CR=1 FL=1
MVVEITEKELKEIDNYIYSGKLVQNMIDNGVSVICRAFILDTLFTKIDDIRREMEDVNVSD